MTDPGLAPAFSVVVPTRNAARTLAACLDSLRGQTLPGVEILVVDNGSTDGTVAIAARRADRVIHCGHERSAQRNRGWQVGGGGFVAFLDADMVLAPEALAQAASMFARDLGIGALVIPEVASGDGFLAACRTLEKRLYLGCARVEAARIFRRSVLAEVGGYDEGLTAFEDWDLADRVSAAGHRTGRIAASVRHDEGRVSLAGAFAKKRYYGRWLRPYLATSRPRRLARPALLACPALLARAPHHAVGLAVLKAVECAGLVVGALRAAHEAKRGEDHIARRESGRGAAHGAGRGTGHGVGL